MPFNALLVLCFMLLLGAVPGRAMAEDSLMIESRHAPGLQVGQPEYALGRLESGFDQARSDDRGWQPLQVPNLLRQPAGAWLRFPVHNLQANASSWYLLLKWPVLDRVTLRVYYPRQDRWGEPMVAGDTLAVSQRPVVDHNLVFPLSLQPGEQAVVYLQLEASELMVLPLELVDEKSFIEGKVLDTALFSLFFGGMIVIVLYNLSLLIFTRDLSYLLYVLYLLSAMFYVGTMSGFGQLVLWPGAPPFSARFYTLSATLCFLTPLLFVVRFLQVRQYGGWVWHITWVLGCYWITVLMAVLLIPEHAHWLFMEYVALPYCLISLAVTLTLWARGNVSARLFSIAWITLLGFTVIHLLALWGYMPLNRLTLHGQLIGMFIEFVLLSMALAERINLERDQRIAAQQLALETSRSLADEREQHLQAKQQALLIQQRANEELETRVVARTKALEEVRHGLELANAELLRLSSTDPLTHLANRRQFDLLLEDEVRRGRRNGTPLTVLLGDIDHFKRVNDSYGHPFGDDCLRRVAAVLQQHCQRAGDLAARYGGEEFVITLPATGGPQAVLLAERMRQDVERLELDCDGERVSLTISFGVATLDSQAAASPLELLSAADRALYEAKRSGRNCVVEAADLGPDGATVFA
ncbi:sensor domain-containing diguanylate cyclase [Stutzerimonas kunmingensis]|uniref:sensor domain-containing diguanylate cyclase n=1 Tax=Stutzerimonas kunmingensis TaxID=1211807 RepID=UPI00289657E4|nr:diguanylate cyclase [Stutzerimonas kunmingensis]